MPENHLLLQSAKSGILVVPAHERRARNIRLAATAVGVVCVLVGAADVTARLVKSIGPDATFLAFAPAVAINNPPLFVAATTPAEIVPARLKIPSLGVDAKVESVGIKADGAMATPSNFDNVAWYSPGAKPGGQGSAVFAGHVNNALLRSGVFEHLAQIKKGSYVMVEDAAGKSLVYRVSSVEEYEPGASTGTLFAATGRSRLVLITCDGEWVPSARSYDKRLVVVAEPAY
jgi:LPXTG-site transpeptidase (sortase) family protein